MRLTGRARAEARGVTHAPRGSGPVTVYDADVQEGAPTARVMPEAGAVPKARHRHGRTAAEATRFQAEE